MRGIFKGSAVSGCTYNYHKETKTKYTYMAFIFDLGNPLLKYAASVLFSWCPCVNYMYKNQGKFDELKHKIILYCCVYFRFIFSAS